MDFDLTDTYSNEFDRQRAEQIAFDMEARKAHLSAEIKYDWQKQREAVEALDNECDRLHNEVMKHSGQAAAYKEALKRITEVYPFTSVAGEQMVRIAFEALQLKYPYPEPTKKTTNR